jgi:hypothetical protein
MMVGGRLPKDVTAGKGFSPLDCRTYSPLCCVVGWLNAFVFEEGEQPVPVLEQAAGRLGHIEIGAGAEHREASADSASYGNRLANKGLPVQMAVLGRFPQGEHSACLGKHPSGESHRTRASAGMFDSLDGSDHVGPAELSDPIVKRLVRRIHVRTKDSRICIAHILSGNPLSA